MANHTKVQAALDTAVTLAIARMQESDYASLLERIEGNVQALRKSGDLDEDDRGSLKTYHEEFVKMCGMARDAQGRVHGPPGLVFCLPSDQCEVIAGLAISLSMWQCAGYGDAAFPGFVH